MYCVRAEQPCVTVCLCCSRWRRLRSSLRGPLRPHRPATDPKIPEMVSAVEAPSSRFVYVDPRASSLSLPAARIPVSRSHATLSIVFCFRNADTNVDGSGPGPVEKSRFCSFQWFLHVFCSVFAGSCAILLIHPGMRSAIWTSIRKKGK